jgi:methylenetetrahydrofolate--tRNA-(uracil-5-)-methyltransferase
MKPVKYSPAHSNSNLAEIVCSNSFKSNLLTNACGLLKEELRILGSDLIKIADEVKVPAGQALAVDRESFADMVTKKIEENENIEVIHEEITKIPEKGITIIATGPLTSEGLSKSIMKLLESTDGLHFFDAAAPIVEKSSIDMNIAFMGNRYDEEKALDEDYEDWLERIKSQEDSYINLPMNKEEYEAFVEELVNAECVVLHDFEKNEIFEGCMPLEVMAKRGKDTLRFGPLKPVGFTDKRTGRRPYAVVQLRQDNKEGTIYNIVGFQTNLKFGEQKRVFSMIPGLQDAVFQKYGVMHRNTYINSVDLLDETYNLKKDNRIYFAGQITGVEGYVESIASGFVAGVNAVKLFEISEEVENEKMAIEENLALNEMSLKELEKIKQKIKVEYDSRKITFDEKTMLGSLSKYISTPKENFQPMNANFGILPELEGKKIRDKKERYMALANRSLEIFKDSKNI